MSSDSPIFEMVTLSFGITGLIANLTLIWAIIKRTPAYFSVYSRILAASTVCEFIMIVGMMITVVKERIFLSACILQFHGICTAISVDFCSIVFGIQQYMYTVTCLLLNFSFVYRLRILDHDANNRKIDYVVILIIAGILVVNFPVISIYHYAEMRQDPIVEQYRLEKGVGSEMAIDKHCIVNYTDLFSLLAVNYSMLTSFIPFIASVIMRKKIIRKLDEMTALNLQLTVSSCSLLGAALFTFNLIMLNIIPDFPETTDAVVVICNMQNVISAFSNLYIITPYRRSLVCSKDSSVIDITHSASTHSTTNAN